MQQANFFYASKVQRCLAFMPNTSIQREQSPSSRWILCIYINDDETYDLHQGIHAMSPLVENQFQQRISLPICPPIWCLSLSLPTYLSISIQNPGHHNVHPTSPTRIVHLIFRTYEHLFLSSLWHHISPTIFHTTQHFLLLISLAFQRSSLFLQDCCLHNVNHVMIYSLQCCARWSFIN
jgi:hypothetical protein